MNEFLAFKLWNLDSQSILKVVKLDSDEERQMFIERNEGYIAVDSLLVQSERIHTK